MSWGAVAGAGISLIGGYLSSKKNKKANNQALDAQQQAYERNTANLQPYMNFGTQWLDVLSQLNNGNFGKFYESPEYQFTRQQGINAQDASAASRGNLFGGAHSRDLTKYASGLASQEYGNFYNRIANSANMGFGAAQALTGVNQNLANAQGNAAWNRADNSNSLIGLGTGLAGNLLNNYFGSRQAQPNSGSRNSSYNSLFSGQVGSGQGSSYNFGNNVGNFANWGY